MMETENLTNEETLPEEIEEPKLFQTVLIQISNGKEGDDLIEREAAFTGEVFVTKEEGVDMKVTGINFLEPMELPEACTFETVETDVESNEHDLPEIVAENSEEETE